jgi:hypothetical protein
LQFEREAEAKRRSNSANMGLTDGEDAN